MGLYKTILRPLLFSIDPEAAHGLASGLSATATKFPFAKRVFRSFLKYDSARLRSTVAGIDFPNPVGLAAGFDKTGKLYPFLSNAGFGYVECGTFTALKQPGNSRPRIFRFPEHEALVNRMGFNNPGAEDAQKNISGQMHTIPRGINLGKSKLTPLEEATEDYVKSLSLLMNHADYITINVSSPNTPNLRMLQEKNVIHALLSTLQKKIRLNKNKDSTVPLFVKLAPDLSLQEFNEILDVLVDIDLDGVILTNTTLNKSILGSKSGIEGGLSGRPLNQKSTEMIRHAFLHTKGKLPIIGVGGIFSGEDIIEKIRAGASLVQIYTGYIYEGPGFPSALCRYLDHYLDKNNTSLSRLVGSAN